MYLSQRCKHPGYYFLEPDPDKLQAQPKRVQEPQADQPGQQGNNHATYGSKLCYPLSSAIAAIQRVPLKPPAAIPIVPQNSEVVSALVRARCRINGVGAGNAKFAS